MYISAWSKVNYFMDYGMICLYEWLMLFIHLIHHLKYRGLGLELGLSYYNHAQSEKHVL